MEKSAAPRRAASPFFDSEIVKPPELKYNNTDWSVLGLQFDSRPR
jgi:hypothetical protein